MFENTKSRKKCQDAELQTDQDGVEFQTLYISVCVQVGSVLKKRSGPAVTMDKGTNLMYVLRHLAYTDQNFIPISNIEISFSIHNMVSQVKYESKIARNVAQ